MRNTFVQSFVKIVEDNEDAYLLTADLGYGVFNPIFEKCPERLINVGVAEANMIGVAAGMAMRGKKVFCYSMVPFLIFRALDQIRASICAMNLPVVLMGVGGGLAYGYEGMTHHAIEDIAVTRALPNMTVFAPGDPMECAMVVDLAMSLNGPSFLRLGGNNDPVMYGGTRRPESWKISCLREGCDIAVIANGALLHHSRKAVDCLAEGEINAGLYSIHTIKPIDSDTILDIAGKYDYILSVEEHNIINGIGTAIGEVLLESGYRGTFAKIGIPDQYATQVGDRDWLRREYGLDDKGIAERIKELLT